MIKSLYITNEQYRHSTTQLRNMFVELSKEGGKTSELFKELSGKSFRDFIAEGNNVQDALMS